MKKNIIIAILGTIVAVIGILMIIGMVAEKNETVRVPIENKDSSFRDNFIVGCMDGDKSEESNCSCYYDSMFRQIGLDGIIELSVDYIETEELPSKVLTKAFSDCI